MNYFNGTTVGLVGSMNELTDYMVEKYITQLGGVFVPYIRPCTDYVIVGSIKNDFFNPAIRVIRQWNASGSEIKLIDEDFFLKLLLENGLKNRKVKVEAKLIKFDSCEQYPSEYVVVDVETTGLSSSDKIIELSAIKIIDGEPINEYTSFVNPQMDIPKAATNVNNITSDMVANAPIFADIAEKFVEFIGDMPIVGHNVSFDVNRIINNELKNIQRSPLKNPLIDTLKLAKDKIDGIDNYKLSTICDVLSITHQHAHASLYDCYATYECYEKLITMKK